MIKMTDCKDYQARWAIYIVLVTIHFHETIKIKSMLALFVFKINLQNITDKICSKDISQNHNGRTA